MAEKRALQKELVIEKAVAEDTNETAWEKWDKWDAAGNLAKKDESSIFNNRQFQVTAAVLAVIVILVLSFS